jgi:hypothetical protein
MWLELTAALAVELAAPEGLHSTRSPTRARCPVLTAARGYASAAGAASPCGWLAAAKGALDTVTACDQATVWRGPGKTAAVLVLCDEAVAWLDEGEAAAAHSNPAAISPSVRQQPKPHMAKQQPSPPTARQPVLEPSPPATKQLPRQKQQSPRGGVSPSQMARPSLPPPPTTRPSPQRTAAVPPPLTPPSLPPGSPPLTAPLPPLVSSPPPGLCFATTGTVGTSRLEGFTDELGDHTTPIGNSY